MTNLTKQQKARFRHECPEWDFMQIDENDREFLACACFTDPEATKAREEHQRDQDADNEQRYIDRLRENPRD